MADRGIVGSVDDPKFWDALDALIGVDRNQIRSTAVCRHLGNANIEYTFSCCGLLVQDVAKDSLGYRSVPIAETLVELTSEGLPMDCPRCRI